MSLTRPNLICAVPFFFSFLFFSGHPYPNISSALSFVRTDVFRVSNVTSMTVQAAASSPPALATEKNSPDDGVQSIAVSRTYSAPAEPPYERRNFWPDHAFHTPPRTSCYGVYASRRDPAYVGWPSKPAAHTMYSTYVCTHPTATAPTAMPGPGSADRH